MAEGRNVEYELELIVRDPMGMRGEVVFEGRTTDPGLAQAIRLLSNPILLDAKLVSECRVYRNGEPISSDQLQQDFRKSYMLPED